jgi:hypothetical protein
VFEAMQREAAVESARAVFLRRGSKARFRDRAVSDAMLKSLPPVIEHSRARLRYIHISALSLLDVLTETQIENYDRARDTSPADSRRPRQLNAEAAGSHRFA